MTHRTETIRSAAPWLLSWVAQQAAFRRATGVQVAIRSGEEVVLDGAWGLADVTTGEPLRTDHLFRIASHSKTFTATAVLQLAEQGRLRLDDPIGQYVPELSGHPVATRTLRELLGHQAGVIRDGDAADFWQLDGPFPDRAALLDDVLAHGEVFGPNQHFKYSNVGYSLLGLAIEAVTGTTYADHLRTAVIEPLGLTRTGAEYDPARSTEYAAGHTSLLDAGDRRERIDHVDTRAMAAATGFYSTAREMTSYGAAHFHGDDTLLTDASKRLIQRQESVVTAYGTETGRYGVGMDLRTIGDRDLVGHSGGYPGHITRTYIDPVGQLVVSVLTNALDGPADPIAVGLIKLIDLALDPPADSTPVAHPERYTGRFANLWGISDIVELGGRLVLIRPTAAEATAGYEELTVIDEDHLRIHAGPGFGTVGEVLTLDRHDDGSIRSIRSAMTQWPIDDFRARRTEMTARR
ncbi:serine hydrolase domain-containing protein [Cellulomonas sp. RIT-PI-Y]|uniref:serine hydrolase domain-containing protein n=1 Tax=Cellulomonas sp. RIT-PI-Y TaxID=3035297 RepID=UPI0021D8B1F0|nr:serine hydrolase domain-containing protein [Cellulomonas sp. RIT-PI-Y]